MRGSCNGMLLVLLCLVVMKWALALSIHEITKGLFEGDIVLTTEQKRLLEDRKATNPASYWPKGSSGIVTVGYRFGDYVINREQVKVAIEQWEQKTCIRFKEVSSDVGDPHLKFVDATSCASYVGRISSMTSGQTIWLHSSCVKTIGPAVHEIGHALGFFHEQSRSDRDDHVKIVWKNIMKGREGNFERKASQNFGVPYDYGSVMHYGPSFFTSNGEETILATNPLAQSLMGNRVGLSFFDKLLANSMYGCLDQWLAQCSITIDYCLNLGYIGPECKCVCPEGTSGEHCEVLEDFYTYALIKLKTPHSETITTEGVVSTPGYPTPIQTATRFVKVLQAPDCYRVKLTFNDFHVSRSNNAGKCVFDAITIRTSETLDTGTAYCGKQIAPGSVFTSEADTIVLDFRNRDYTALNWNSPYRGFNATIQHIASDKCALPTTSLLKRSPSSTAKTSPDKGNFIKRLLLPGYFDHA